MDKQRQEEVIKALQEKHATGSCPRCSNLQFDVVGEGMLQLKEDPRFLEAWQVPVILVSCTNCGYIAQHVAAVLGMKR